MIERCYGFGKAVSNCSDRNASYSTKVSIYSLYDISLVLAYEFVMDNTDDLHKICLSVFKLAKTLEKS